MRRPGRVLNADELYRRSLSSRLAWMREVAPTLRYAQDGAPSPVSSLRGLMYVLCFLPRHFRAGLQIVSSLRDLEPRQG